jgi:HSP20 family protein
MTLVRFKQDFKPSVNSLFDTFFDRPMTDFFSDSALIRQIPAVNIRETDTNYQVELAAPGLKKDDFKISLYKDLLTISAELTSESNDDQNGYTRREFSYSNFKRSFSLPEKADKESIKAGYENGILSLTIPKITQKAESSRFIEVS